MTMTDTIKSLVSKKKRRYKEGDFNLDLTYIIDGRLIAMGYPSENVESLYRNALVDVKRMLEQNHKDHYKIYNLCSERSYDIQKFHSRVSVYPFDDHNPPEFGQMRPFCEDVSRWLDENEKNVAVVHCKAGKGRTGLMICAYLLHRRLYKTAEDVLKYYGSKRTLDTKGVTIPSQRRYVDYYAAMMSQGLQYNPVKMYLTSIVIDPLPQLGLGQHEGYIQFEVRQTNIRPFVSDVYLVKRTDGRINIELQNPIVIVGDVKIDFTQKIKLDILNLSGRPRYVSNVPNGKLFHFWVNTFFIDQQRSSDLTHDSCVGPGLATTSIPVTSCSPGFSEPSFQYDVRGTRSQHTSGDTLGPDSPLPPPRLLRPTLSTGDPRSVEPTAQSSSDDQCEEHSPNGTCLRSVQTLHSHPPARTVSIVDHSDQDVPGRPDCDRDMSSEIKHMSISDDFLALEQARRANAERAEATTHKSFIENRQRHSSVPQTARTQGQHSGLQSRSRRNIPPGRLMSVRLNKSQIDKASKDKSGKFSENFNVTLFLVRPNDQTLQAEFSRSNLICQRGVEPLPSDTTQESSEDSSEEEPELRRGERHLEQTFHSQERVSRTLTAPLPSSLSGLVRNSTEPHQRLSEMAVSQSTWI
jgi:phosphatidylinositol-3,4,5-trisphosphate 3-phosphatase/dual-specificity protein phosphatase PTEN